MSISSVLFSFIFIIVFILFSAICFSKHKKRTFSSNEQILKELRQIRSFFTSHVSIYLIDYYGADFNFLDWYRNLNELIIYLEDNPPNEAVQDVLDTYELSLNEMASLINSIKGKPNAPLSEFTLVIIDNIDLFLDELILAART